MNGFATRPGPHLRNRLPCVAHLAGDQAARERISLRPGSHGRLLICRPTKGSGTHRQSARNETNRCSSTCISSIRQSGSLCGQPELRSGAFISPFPHARGALLFAGAIWRGR